MSKAIKPRKRRRPPSAPPNLAAKVLRTPAFRPRVPENPKAYKRKGRHALQLLRRPPEPDGD